MLKLKSCPKCHGDVVVDRDQWGWYEQCIQCGYLHDLQNMIEVRQRQTREAKRKRSSILRNQSQLHQGLRLFSKRCQAEIHHSRRKAILVKKDSSLHLGLPILISSLINCAGGIQHKMNYTLRGIRFRVKARNH